MNSKIYYIILIIVFSNLRCKFENEKTIKLYQYLGHTFN